MRERELCSILAVLQLTPPDVLNLAVHQADEGVRPVTFRRSPSCDVGGNAAGAI